MKYKTNIDYEATQKPVRDFLFEELPLYERVGGLLDYGYDPWQIANMLEISIVTVNQIMESHHYATVDKLMEPDEAKS